MSDPEHRLCNTYDVTTSTRLGVTTRHRPSYGSENALRKVPILTFSLQSGEWSLLVSHDFPLPVGEKKSTLTSVPVLNWTQYTDWVSYKCNLVLTVSTWR